MNEYLVGAIGFAIAMLVAWWFQAPILVMVAVIAGIIGITVQREWSYLAGDWDASATAPKPQPGPPTIDLDDEIADLLVSARHLAARRIADDRHFVGFVMYEDADGNVKVRSLRPERHESAESHAREVARALDASVPRVVTATTGRVDLNGRLRPAIVFEAAQGGRRPRTARFAQRYRPRRGLRRAVESGPLLYIGEGDHVLRFPVGRATTS